MTNIINQPVAIKRVPSGIEGFDQILRGGFLKGEMYLLMGPPGAGKTIFGNQICFHHVATSGRAIYLTLLAETHSRILSHINDHGLDVASTFTSAEAILAGIAHNPSASKEDSLSSRKEQQ